MSGKSCDFTREETLFHFQFNAILSYHSTDPRYYTSSVRQELRETLSALQKTTHNFVREHDELANRAEYLKYVDPGGGSARKTQQITHS